MHSFSRSPAVVMPARGWRRADLPLYLFIVVSTIAAGHALGAATRGADGALPWRASVVFLVACAAYECLFIAWLRRTAGRSVPAANVRRFALRIQLHAGAQMVSRCIVLAAFVTLIDAMMSEQPLTSPWSAQAAVVAGPVAWFLLHLAVVWLISIAWWLTVALQRRGADFTALCDGTYTHQSRQFAAGFDAAAAALERHVNRLGSPGTPRFSRMLYQANLTVVPDGEAAYILTWTLLPVRVRVQLSAAGIQATRLTVDCQLRGGIHRLELTPSPAVILALTLYLQTHLLDPMASDLTLSGAVRKQDQFRHKAMAAELRMLQAQIEPHFLFNTLANLRHLYRSSTEEGEVMLDHIILYLRSTLEDLRAEVSTVGREMDVALHYLAIMKVRMGARLSYSFVQADRVATLAFPPAMLISLVENAVMHGLHSRPDGQLTITAATEARRLELTVLDNGAGFSSVQGTGVGLSNIRQRLEAMYGADAWLEVGAVASGGFMARIVIPIQENP